MKKFLRWPNLPPAESLPKALCDWPNMKAWIEDERLNALPYIDIPQVCHDSKSRAMDKLILQALGLKRDKIGDARFGDTPISAERLFLSKVEASGTARTRGLDVFTNNLWKSAWQSTPNENSSEVRLNRFLIKLGRALESTKKRSNLPDWLHKVDQTERFIVEGWCNRIQVDGEMWPPLCCLTTPALVKFLRLCNVKHCKLATKDARTIEKAIQRLGLVRVPRKWRLKHIKKKFGEFRFA